MTPFMWCAVIGCGILALSLVLDGLFDGLGLDDTGFDGALPVIATALGVFGAAGAGVQAMTGQMAGWHMATAVLIGVPLAAALVAGAGTRALWVRMRRSMPRNAVPLTPGELVGTEVRIMWWKDGRGEVIASSRGHQLTLEARSEEPLRAGSTAVVLEAADDVLVVTSLALDA